MSAKRGPRMSDASVSVSSINSGRARIPAGKRRVRGIWQEVRGGGGLGIGGKRRFPAPFLAQLGIETPQFDQPPPRGVERGAAGSEAVGEVLPFLTGAGSGLAALGDQGGGSRRRADARVQDRFQARARVRVREHERAHARAVERAVRRGVAGSERLDQGRHRRPARRGERVRDLVGVDDRGAALGEQVGDGRLAAADPAGQADAEA